MPVTAARPEDLPAIRALLDRQGLPSSDLEERSLRSFLVLREGEDLHGVVGLDLLGEFAMLRSLAVGESWRGAGLGSQLVAAAEALAAKLGITSLYLLTTDAEPYFAAKGYRTLARPQAPPEVKLHPQFRGLCPSSSIFMSKTMSPQTIKPLLQR